jgi:RNA polymerase sigma factor (TIGR02999 family)
LLTFNPGVRYNHVRSPSFSRILSAIEQGDGQLAERLLPLVYDESRKLAAAKLATEKPGQTLQATALVHEAYIRLVDQSTPQQWESSRHFFAAAAESMRRILVERARQRQSCRSPATISWGWKRLCRSWNRMTPVSHSW